MDYTKKTEVKTVKLENHICLRTQLSTYPTQNPTFCLKGELNVNVGFIGEG